MAKVYCFGDSNGYGSDLLPGEKPFVHWLATAMGVEYCNYAEEGSSLGIVQHRLVVRHKEITKDDFVVVIIPPDARWYDESEEAGFFSFANYDIVEYYEQFLKEKTLEWFEYHHALFTYTIQQLLNNIGCEYVMILTAGRLGGQHYNLPIDYTKFLSDEDMLNFLSREKNIWDNYPHHVLPKEHRFMHLGAPQDFWDLSSPYIGSGGHPTELGHKRIAEMILARI